MQPVFRVMFSGLAIASVTLVAADNTSRDASSDGLKSAGTLSIPASDVEKRPLISAKRKGEIVDELNQLAEKDRKARLAWYELAPKDQKAAWKRIQEMDARNSQWLRGIVKEVGWLDVERFTESVSFEAIYIIVHSANVPLMKSVLPEVAKDKGKSEFMLQSYGLLKHRVMGFEGATNEQLDAVAKEYGIHEKK